MSLIPPLAKQPINNYLEKNNPKLKVNKIGVVKTGVNEYGDMDLNEYAEGEMPGLGSKTVSVPTPARGKTTIFGRTIYYPTIKMVPVTIPLPETINISVGVQVPFIRNYQSYVQSAIYSYY